MVAFYFLVMVCNASFQPYVEKILPIFIAPKLKNFRHVLKWLVWRLRWRCLAIFVDNSVGFGWCGGNSNIFGIFTPKIGEETHPFSLIFFKWVGSATNQMCFLWMFLETRTFKSFCLTWFPLQTCEKSPIWLGFKDGRRCWERNRICNRCRFYSFSVINRF